MQGDFSRSTFDKKKHYRLVMRQQGRVDVDADWNEQQAIVRHYGETEATDVIGQAGVPQGLPNSFLVSADAAGNLSLGAGRMYVDGILCENDIDNLDLFKQQDLPLSNKSIAGPVPVALPLDTAKGVYVAYLDVWLRHLTAVDDPSIREKALGGPDTASRAKVVWQVKLLDVSKVTPPVACGFFPPKDFSPPSGKLDARTPPPVGGKGPCVLPPEAGYRRLQNQLYRVQIHSGGDAGVATFKWSRENGSVVIGVTGALAMDGQALMVQDLGRDDNLGFHDGDWVELLDDTSELNDFHGALLKIGTIAPDTNVINISTDTPVPAGALKNKNVRLRRWDQTGVSAGAGNIIGGLPVPSVAGQWIPLEDGLEINFGAGHFNAGDYWLIPARTAIDGETGNLDWPDWPQSPLGIRHHYAALAVIDYTQSVTPPGGVAGPMVTRCVKTFPPLTGLNPPAAPTPCKCCAMTLGPDDDWQTALQTLQQQVADEKIESAHICFQIGNYVIDPKKGPIVLSGFKSLKFGGAGTGTRIIAPAIAEQAPVLAEVVFKFVGCQSVEISDLAAESRQITQGKDPVKLKKEDESIGIGRQGVLTFRDCQSVSVTNVTLQGADGTLGSRGIVRTASCITVYNAPNTAPPDLTPIITSVRVRHCNLTVGHYQIGVQVSNADRLQVEDNILTVNPTRSPLIFSQILQDKGVRASFRRLLVSNANLEVAQKPAAPARGDATAAKTVPRAAPKAPVAGIPRSPINGSIKAGGAILNFHTPRALEAVWPKLLGEPQFKAISVQPLQKQLKIVADRILTDPKLRRVDPALLAWYIRIEKEWLATPTSAAQGIVVGGQTSTDVRIRDNTLTGFAQGIHVGLSDRASDETDRVSADAPAKSATHLDISGNTIHCYSAHDLRGRQGIFVGNCANAIIHGNRLSISGVTQSESGRTIDGIRLFGFFGPQLVVTSNSLSGFFGGITLQELPGLSGPPKVRVRRDNYVVGPNGPQPDKFDP